MLEVQISSHSPQIVPWTGILALFGQIFWVFLIIYIFNKIGASKFSTLLTRVDEVAIAGLTLRLATEITTIAEAKGLEILGGEASIAARRLSASRSLVEGARILWVDDHPDNNRIESRLLKSVGATIDRAISTDEALRLDLYFEYDVIVSDMVRGLERDAGEILADKVASRQNPTPVILYVGRPRPVPASVFALTVRPDELIHLILDALSRQRY